MDGQIDRWTDRQINSQRYSQTNRWSQWLRSAIPDSQQPSSPIGFLFLKLPPPPCAVLLVSQVLTTLSTALFVLAPGHILTMWPLGALQQTNTCSVYLPWNHLIIQPAKIMLYDNTTRSQGWCAYHYPGLHPHRAVEQTKSPYNPVRVGKQDHNMEAKGNHTRMCIYS